MTSTIPKYALAPIRRSADAIVEINDLLHLSMSGLGIVSNRPKMINRIVTLEGEMSDERRSELERANKDAEFTNKEIQNDFPLLHAYSLVAQWAALEAGVEDALVGILVNEPAALQKTEFEKIKIPLFKYEQLDQEERMRFLFGELQRMKSSGLAQGVNTFEDLLQTFDLSGEVRDELRAALWEMNNLRNVIVHRDSHVDRRLREACPNMNLKIGDRISIRHERYGHYMMAALDYLSLVVRRLGVRYQADPPQWARPEFDSLGRRVDDS